MPTDYKRVSNRGSWSQIDLDAAINLIKNENISIRAAARATGVPEKTLRNRILKNNFLKQAMGPAPVLGNDAEVKLVQHIKALQARGFAPSRRSVRKIAFNLAEAMGVKHTFNKMKRMAGNDWFKSFMRRNHSLSVRKAQGLSNARAEGMNKKECNEYFELLKKTLTEHDLINKPGCIWNVDESGLQLNNEPGVVVAIRGSDVHVRQSAERGETVTVVACANAEGVFLPPYCIFKGVKKQQIWQESMPTGAAIEMRRESAYIDENIFMKWFQEHFLPRKPPGKCLLLLDGHGSHTNSPEILECATNNDVVLLCLPSHTTQYLQPLDRAFFKPLKAYYRNASSEWGNANPGKKLERRHFGELLAQAWSKAATLQTGISGFRACGIYPLKPSAIPEDAFLTTADNESRSSDQQSDSERECKSSLLRTSSNSSSISIPAMQGTSVDQIGTADVSEFSKTSNIDQTAQPSTSKDVTVIVTPIKTSSPCLREKPTPTKLLLEVSPIPKPIAKKQTPRKQSAQVLTSPDVIAEKRRRRLATIEKKKLAAEKKALYEKTLPKKREDKDSKKRRNAKGKSFGKKKKYSSSESEDELVSSSSEDESLHNDSNICIECYENYNTTTSKADWVECIRCARWMHETCTLYEEKCNRCGRSEAKNKNLKK